MQEARELFEKFKAGKANPDEMLLLQKWFHELGEDKPSGLSESDLLEAKRSFQKHTNTLFESRPYAIWQQIASIAAIFILTSAAIYFYKLNQADKPIEQYSKEKKYDIEPGGNKAILTLADGRRIDLNQAINGELADQSGIKVTKTTDGQIVYSVVTPGSNSPNLSYNAIETPPGGQYQIKLPDGSNVWLNSASSLRYPVRFSGNERNVEIIGEAYFEVAPNPKMPFRVKNTFQTIEVLGTHFNVMSYTNESTINTTLVEGSVKVVGNFGNKTLKPGQQSRVSSKGVELLMVDLEEVTAWKNGYFIFKSEDLQSIMRQIARWYDVDIEIHGDVAGKTFGGRISRSRNVSEVLEVLESTGSLKFKVLNGGNAGKERRIVVMP